MNLMFSSRMFLRIVGLFLVATLSANTLAQQPQRGQVHYLDANPSRLKISEESTSRRFGSGLELDAQSMVDSSREPAVPRQLTVRQQAMSQSQTADRHHFVARDQPIRQPQQIMHSQPQTQPHSQPQPWEPQPSMVSSNPDVSLGSPPPIMMDRQVRLATAVETPENRGEPTVPRANQDRIFPDFIRKLSEIGEQDTQGERVVNEKLDKRASSWLALGDQPETPTRKKEGEDQDKSTSNPSKLQELISKIASSTILVLVIGVGVIVIAKAIGPKQKTTSTTPADEFNVLSQLQLPSKSQLMLVDVEGRRLVVAIDSTGVKAVIPFQETETPEQSFSDTLAKVAESMPALAPAAPPVTERSVGQRGPAEEDMLPAETKARTKARTETRAAAESSEEAAYSLRTIGRRLETRGEEEAREREEQSMHDAMEAAMAKSGLKELILNSIRNA